MIDETLQESAQELAAKILFEVDDVLFGNLSKEDPLLNVTTIHIFTFMFLSKVFSSINADIKSIEDVLENMFTQVLTSVKISREIDRSTSPHMH